MRCGLGYSTQSSVMYVFELRCAGPFPKYGLSSVMWLLVWAGRDCDPEQRQRKTLLPLQGRQTCLRRLPGENELPEVALKQHPKGKCTIEC